MVWYESTRYVNNAIAREKEIKNFSREKKLALIDATNQEWKFLNTEIIGHWPPTNAEVEVVKEWMAAAEQRRENNDGTIGETPPLPVLET